MAKKWAISIGINHYGNMLDLDFAKKDAEKMRDWFVAAGFDKIYLFTDDSPPIEDASQPYDSQPTGNTLKRFFRIRFQPDTLSIEDSIWFFFSGHGLRHEGKDYLMPCDGDAHPEGVAETSILLSDVTQKLRDCGAGDVVIIYDACRNKSKAGGSGFGAIKTKGVITLASCSANERSYEIDHPAIEQGSFTYALLEALENTQLGKGNYATFDRLYQRLRYRVPEINRQFHKPTQQHPSGYVEPDEKRYCILLPQRATIQDIEVYKKQALNAEINNNLHEAERLLIRLWEICPGDPEVRQYYNRVILKKAQQSVVVRDVAEEQGAGGKGNQITSNPPQPDTTEVKFAATEIEEVISVSSAEKTPATKSDKPIFSFEVVTVDKKGQEISKETRQAEYFTEDLGNNVTLDLVYIPGGTFTMGSPAREGYDDEKPQHEVTVKPFLMGKYPVTQAQWKEVAAFPKVNHDLKAAPSNFTGDNLPVERVSWYDAVEFCERLSKKTGQEYRLPSEAEWEYACRAGTNTPFHFGETITGKLANYNATKTYAEEAPGEYRKTTTAVGKFLPNAFGLYDVHGNVLEWCADNWHDNYEGAPTDGTAWTTGGDNNRSPLRGGSWYNYPYLCRSAYRNLSFRRRDGIGIVVGFRIVRSSGRT